MGDFNLGGSRQTGITGAERSELATVLASPTFARAQRLIKLLEYICEKHFEGQDAELCEYGIATEVLGRPTDFDPSEDAIARVEIHRLRKKLREYYAAEGSHQALKIIIPPGMYTPIFQQDGNSTAASANDGKALAEGVPQARVELIAGTVPESIADRTATGTFERGMDEPELPPNEPAKRSPARRGIWLWAGIA